MSQAFTKTIQMYNQFAAKFAEHYEKKLGVAELDRFLKYISPGGQILDAGCGAARDSAYFIAKGYRAYGIDLSEGLLAQANKIHPEVPTQLMSLTKISLADEQFDGVWCKAALLHVNRDEVALVLKSFHRILKPGGIMFIQTKEGVGEGLQSAPFDTNVHRLFTFFSLDELTHLVAEAGFTLLESTVFNGKQRNANSRNIDWIVLYAKK